MTMDYTDTPRITTTTTNEQTTSDNINVKRTTTSTDDDMLKSILRNSLESLHASSTNDLDEIALLLKTCMGSKGRNYHQLDHVIYVASGGDDAIFQLAGLFHDVIYTNIEGESLCDGQVDLLKGVADEHGKANLISNEPNVKMVKHIFQVSSDKPKQGWDEFLSAIVAMRVLGPFLTPSQLIQIAVCIEATIPFRSPSAMDALYKRLQHVNLVHGLNLSDKECIHSIQRAAEMANRDVDNFAYKDPALFLDKTWMLLPEMNAQLRTNSYTAKYYQEAIHKMCCFFNGYLNADNIFKSFQGIPSIQESTERARYNVEIAKRYLQAKLLSASIVSAVAELTGDAEAPLLTFVGTWWPLPFMEGPKVWEDIDWTVHRLLTNGRVAETDFDIKASPLAALLHWSLPLERIQALVKQDFVPMTPDKARTLLQQLPSQLVQVVVDRIVINVPSRKQVLLHSVSTIRTQG